MTTFQTSAAGRALIEKWEGCRLDAYQDIVGVWTIGYGDTGPDVVGGLTITQQQADDRLSRRLAMEFEPGVNGALGDSPTTQGQFDAMVSLAYNIGIGGFRGSEMLAQHRAGNWAEAAADFLHWDHAGGREVDGLRNRRQEEADMYLAASPA